MKRIANLGYIIGILGVFALGFALLAPSSLVNAARDQLPVNRTAIVDGYFPERAASVDAMGRLKVDVADPLTVQVTNFPLAQDVRVANKSLAVDGTVKVSNLPVVQQVSGTVNVGNLQSTQNVNVTNATLPVSGSISVANLPTVQPVNGTVNVGNLPTLDPSKVFNFFTSQITQAKPLDACTAGHGFVVPAGQSLLITDIVTNLHGNASTFPGLWSETRGTLFVLNANADTAAFKFSTPLVLTSGERICVYQAIEAGIFDTFLSGQYMKTP